MIQANELRIGNWVDRGINTNVYYKIKPSDFVNTDFGITKPIPLTPEILEKCGFAKAEDSFAGYLISIAEDEKIRIAHNGFVWIWPLYANNPVVVNNLHQLQNLYFALTGEELNVQL